MIVKLTEEQIEMMLNIIKEWDGFMVNKDEDLVDVSNTELFISLETALSHDCKDELIEKIGRYISDDIYVNSMEDDYLKKNEIRFNKGLELAQEIVKEF